MSNKNTLGSASEDLKTVFENVELQCYEVEGGEGREYRKRQRKTERSGTRVTSAGEAVRASTVKTKIPPKKTSREVYIALLPDRYEPLIEEEENEGEDERIKQEKKKRKKEKHKKYRKNLGKALRFSWRCLVAGLQSLASGYATPLSATATLVTQVHRTNQ
ncbi:hypothetical protein UPYG_G00226080 [Umbra pygmaea]|uniref:Uncharacterized protein n=1 Tax=Umbra pygmaea TaxID=75934 RepID=A0ABD0WCI5_UMBPY